MKKGNTTMDEESTEAQELFDKIDPMEQTIILAFMRALLDRKTTNKPSPLLELLR